MWLPGFLAPAPMPGQIRLLACTALLTVFNGILLMAVLWRTGITRTRSGLPIVLYMFLISSVTALHTDWASQLAVSAFQVVLLLVLSAYHQEHAVEQSFLATLLLCIGALAVPDMLWLVPVLWLLLVTQRAFNFRTWLASLTGCALVALYAALMHCARWICIATPQQILARTAVASWNSINLAVAVAVLAEGIFFIVCLLTRLRQENHHVRSYITCITLPFLLTGILMFFPPLFFPSLLAVSLLLLAGLAAWLFYSRNSVFAGTVFIVHTLLWTAIWLLSTAPCFQKA